MKSIRQRLLYISAVSVLVFSCAGKHLDATSQAGAKQVGIAAYYSDKLHGRTTANGEKYNKNAFTAAHRHLPFGTEVRVTNLKNRRTVQVRINDRGPFGGKGRIIDLSRAAAERLDMIQDGIVKVELEILKIPQKK